MVPTPTEGQPVHLVCMCGINVMMAGSPVLTPCHLSFVREKTMSEMKGICIDICIDIRNSPDKHRGLVCKFMLPRESSCISATYISASSIESDWVPCVGPFASKRKLPVSSI